MSYTNRPRAKSALRFAQIPWVLFLFLAAVFFLCQHDLFYSLKVTQGYNSSAGQVVTALDAGSLNRQIALWSLCLFAVFSLIAHRGARLRINGTLGWIMLFYAGLAFLSLAWAENAALSFRRLVVFAILCVAATAIARRFSLRQVVLWVFCATGLYLLIGVAAELALGTFHPFASGYRFAGTIHPNHQGINCALLVLSGVAAADMEKRKKMIFRLCALVGFPFLILTGSRTAFAAAILALAVYFGMVCSRRTKIVAVFAALAIGVTLWAPFVIGGSAVPDFERALMLGRNASKIDTFNGRSDVWENVRPYIDRRPVLGYGYGGFWSARHVTEISDATQRLGRHRFGVEESHDAYLDCLLDLGFVGLAAFIFLLVGSMTGSFARYRASQAPAFGFCGAFFAFCLANGLLESATVGSIFLTFLILTISIHLGFRQTDTESSRRAPIIHREMIEVLS